MKNNYNFGVVKLHLKFIQRTTSTPHKFQIRFPSQNLILFQPDLCLKKGMRLKMKIDLHCHTKKTKSGDDEARNVTPELFKEKVINSNVRIIGVTNHNLFDIQQYRELKESVKGIAQVWPGIELDIKYNNIIGHLIVIYNPNKVNEFESILNMIIEGRQPDQVEIDLKKFVKFFADKDAIFIAHDYKKSQSFSQEMIEILKNEIVEKYRIFSEPSNFKSLSIMLDNGIQAMLGSDIKDWNKYPNCDLPELKLDVDSFEKLILLAKKDRATINTLLNKKEQKIKEIQIKVNDTKKEKIKIPIYNDINIIFGAKGTGKTAVLNGLRNKYLQEGNKYSLYKASGVDEVIEQKLKFKDTERTNTNIDISPIKEMLDFIRNWKEVLPTSFNDYIEYSKTKKNNKNKAKLKITSLKTTLKNNTKLNKLKNEYKIVNNIMDQIDKYKLDKYLNSEDSKIYKEINKKIKEGCFSLLKSEYIEYYSNKLTNTSIKIVKQKADLCTTSKSLPNSTGFLEFSQNYLNLKNHIKNFKECMNSKTEKNREKIGNLDEGKEVYLSIEHRVFKSKIKEFKYGQNISDLNKVCNLILGLDKNLKVEISEKIDNIIQEFDRINLRAKDFIGIKKQYENKLGEYYKPSDGEKIMLILHKKLYEDADVYLLDEPERSLGNTFINSVIVPRIVELGKMGKTVIIATHNANIAVRTLPFTSILKTYENGKYKTYIGNPFTNELINIENDKEMKNWKDESIKVLEGGKEAFEDRRRVYESR